MENEAKPLASSLQNILGEVTKSQPNAGSMPQTKDSPGMKLSVSGEASAGTGMALTPTEAALKPIGPEHGLIMWTEPPKDAEEAAQRAKDLVARLLPQQVQVFLTASEESMMRASSVGFKVIPIPTLTPEQRQQVQANLAALNRLLTPARELGPKLEMLLIQLFSAFNIYTGDESKLKAQLSVWADELEGFPMWAIKVAYKWTIRSDRKLPSLAEFLHTTKFVMGNNTLERKRMIENMLNGRNA